MKFDKRREFRRIVVGGFDFKNSWAERAEKWFEVTVNIKTIFCEQLISRVSAYTKVINRIAKAKKKKREIV